MYNDMLPPSPMELFERAGGPNFKDMFSQASSMDALPIPDPLDFQKIAKGFIPSPADVGKLGQEMVTGGVSDKVQIASALLVPPLLLGGVVVASIGVVVLLAGGLK